MKVNCPQVACALDLLKKSGNQVLEVTHGWSKVKEDYRMKHVLTPELKNKVMLKEPSLEYWSYRGSPHNAADEGFVCKEHGVSISFPVEE